MSWIDNLPLCRRNEGTSFDFLLNMTFLSGLFLHCRSRWRYTGNKTTSRGSAWRYGAKKGVKTKQLKLTKIVRRKTGRYLLRAEATLLCNNSTIQTYVSLRSRVLLRLLTLLLRLCGYWSQDLFNTQWWILVALKRADYGSARTLGCNWVFFGIIVRQLYCRTQFGPLIGPIQKPPSSSSKMMPTCKFSWQPRIIRFSKLWLTRLDSSFT